jgi:glycosyltransferase involved in cell wall biosynthesis
VRIAQVMAGAPNGGAELFYERMTVALAGVGQDVLPLLRIDEGRAGRLAAAGLMPQEFRFGGPLDVFTKPALARALRKFRAEIAVAWMSRAAAKLPHGDWVNVGRLGGYYDLKYFGSCEHLVGNTRGIVAWIAEQKTWPREKIHYLPNFVEDFGDAEAAARDELGVPEGAPMMLGLGRLHAVKGFDTLIRAAALLPEVYCVIAGEGPERKRLEHLIAELGVRQRVKLLGWRSDSGALLKAADVFVSSSRHEPLGNMVLEAFAAQTPVLAAKSEGPAEVIRNGEDGVLVAADDVAALASGARALLGDVRLRVKLALAARQRYAAEFSRAVVVAAWLELFERIAG